MKTALKFRKFNREKKVEELGYSISLWTTELEFVEVELQFILKLMKSYPFSNEVPNLFERIQLFIKEINTLDKENINLLGDIRNYEVLLNSMLEGTDMNTTDSHMSPYEKIAAQVFDYKQRYRDFKRKIYEYVSSIT